MAVLWEPAYLAVRCSAWWLLWLAANVYGCLRRNARGKGWKLHWGVRAVLTTQVVAEVVRLATAQATYNLSPEETAQHASWKALIFFQNLDDAAFMFLLLLISSGYCITRNTLGVYRNKVIGIPFAYGITSMIVDYIILASRSSAIITRQKPEEEVEDFGGTLLFIALAVKIVTFILSWLLVFDNLSQEIKMLRGNEYDDPPELDRNEEPRQEGGDGEEEVPTSLLPGSQNRSHLGIGNDVEGGGNLGQEEEEETTVEDIIMTSAKLKLLGRFFHGLLLYVVASVIVELLPIYINSGNSNSVERFQDVLDVFHNAILFLFLATLSWIFRPMDDNPYLMVGEDFDEDGEAPTTELGVIVSEENQPGHPTSANTRAGAGMKTEIDENFALEDDEDLSELTTGGLDSNQRRESSPRRRPPPVPHHSPKKSS